MKLFQQKVSEEYPPIVIAEAGINHDGSLEKAFKLVDAAKSSGVKIIKFQCHVLKDEMIKTDMRPGKISDEPLWDIIDRCQFDFNDEMKIKLYAESKGLNFLSTPFSRAAVDRLEKMEVEAYKIGSGECNNYPLIDYIAKKRKPIILSTGMNNISSIDKAVKIIKENKCDFALLHCTSMYPTPYKNVKLGAITNLRMKYPGIPVGVSDHSLKIWTALSSVTLGATIIEKHFTVDKNWVGPDIAISLDPKELKELVKGSKAVWEAKGGKKEIQNQEKPVIDFAYASIVSIKNIKKGDAFSYNNIWVKRPGTGELKADQFFNLLGKKANIDISKDTFIEKKFIDE